MRYDKEQLDKLKGERDRLRSERGFTLIELMATLAILAIIIAIAIPAVGNLLDKADASADDSSIELMERAGELADVDGLAHDEGVLSESGSVETEAYRIPTLIEEGFLNMEEDNKFNKPENYVVRVNESGTYVYKGEGQRSGGGAGDGSGSDGDSDNGDETLPGLEDVAAGSCTIEGAYASVPVQTDYDWLYSDRPGSYYEQMTQDLDGNYIAAGETTIYSKDGESAEYGFVLDKYNKDLQLIDQGVSFEHMLVDSPTLSVLTNNDGGYVVGQLDGLSLFDADLNYVKSMTFSEPGSGWQEDKIQLTQANDGLYFVVSSERESD